MRPRRALQPSGEPLAEKAAPPLWPRFLLPAAFVLLFLLSLGLFTWDTRRPPARRVMTPVPAPALGTPAGTVTSPTTITFACDDTTGLRSDYVELARTFEAANPDITVAVKSIAELRGITNPSEDRQLEMQEIAARADVFCIWDIAPLARAYYLYDLTWFAAADPAFQPEDFYDAVLETGRYRGRLYAVPSRFQPAIIRYDPAAFDAAHLAYPRAGWTWQEFADDAIRLTDRRQGGTVRWGFAEESGVVFSARLLAATGDPELLAAAGSSNPLGSEALLDVRRWYDRLYVKERGAPAPRYLDLRTAGYAPPYLGPEEVAQRRAAMWTDLMVQSARRQGKPAPLPSDGQNEGRSPFFTSPAWAMAAGTLHPEAAWRWLSYLSHNPPPDRYWSRLPARRSLVEQSEFWKDLPAAESEVYQYILDHLVASPAGGLSTVVQRLYGDLVAMVTGKVSLEQLAGQPALPTPPASSSPSVRITIRFAVPAEQIANYSELARAFAQEQGIGVDVVARENLSDQARSETATLWAQLRQVANRADVVAGPEVALLVRSGRAEGILRDLTRLVASLPAEDFYSNVLESLEWQGKTFAVPARVSAYLVHYNQWMFDQNGVAYPKIGWTWDDFAQTAQAVTRRGEDNLWWHGAVDGPSNQSMLLAARTGPLVNYGVQPAAPLLDRVATIDAVGWYAALVRAGAIAAPGALVSSDEGAASPPASAAPDDAAMWVAPAELYALEELRKGSIGAVPFPADSDADRTNPIEIVDAYAISASSGQVVVAWQWILYLLAHQPANDATHPGVPARRQAGMAIDEDPGTQQVYRSAIEHARPVDALRPENYLVQRAFDTALSAVVRGEKDAKAALEAAQRDAQSAIGK